MISNLFRSSELECSTGYEFVRTSFYYKKFISLKSKMQIEDIDMTFIEIATIPITAATFR